MKLSNKITRLTGALFISCLFFSCQEFDRPEMILIPDNTDGPTSPLLLYFAFENQTVVDSSIYHFQTYPTTGLSFRNDGANGSALNIGVKNYFIVDHPQIEEGKTNPMDYIRNIGSFTISFWMNLPKTSAGGAQGILAITDTTKAWSNLDIFSDGTNAQGNLQFKIHLNNQSTDRWIEGLYVPVLDKWSHMVFRYNGKSSLFTIFANGEVVYRNTLTGFGNIRFNNLGKIVIGTFQNSTIPSSTKDPEVFSWASSFKGSLDQFRLYNKSLTDQEVLDLFQSKK